MKKLITLVITIVITTMSYAQVEDVLYSNSNQMCVWSFRLEKWTCKDTVYCPIKFTLINEVFYLNDKTESKYILHEKGNYEEHEGYSAIFFDNSTDQNNEKCMFSIFTSLTGSKVIIITYKNYSIEYFII